MGDLNSFKTYEEFEAAVKEEIKYITKVDQRCYGYFPESSQRAGSEASDVHYVRGLYGKGKGRILRRRYV